MQTEYSDSIVKILVERHLTSSGIDGIFMKNYKSGKRKFRKPRVTHSKRVVKKMDRNIYCDTESVKFLNLQLEQIFDKFSASR